VNASLGIMTPDISGRIEEHGSNKADEESSSLHDPMDPEKAAFRKETEPSSSSPSNDEKPHTAKLSEEEQAIIDRQIQVPNDKIGYFSLFRYASGKEVLIMIVSLLAAITAGATMPLMTLVYGNFAGSFTTVTTDPSAMNGFQHQINTFALYFVYLGIASLTTVYISVIGFSYTGERIAQKIRERYLQAIFRQNIAFFDFLGSGEITTRISSGQCPLPAFSEVLLC
jgi:ATP-binding cassette subfamily B (MDR/TAP) protein 1